jgi:hypothetical protein
MDIHTEEDLIRCLCAFSIAPLTLLKERQCGKKDNYDHLLKLRPLVKMRVVVKKLNFSHDPPVVFTKSKPINSILLTVSHQPYQAAVALNGNYSGLVVGALTRAGTLWGGSREHCFCHLILNNA